MYPLNYKPVTASNSTSSYSLNHTTTLGISYMAYTSTITPRSASEIYKPFTKIFWNLLVFYLRGGYELREINSGTPPYLTYDSNNKFICTNFDAGMGNSIYEITKEGENYLKLVQNTYQNDQVSGSDLKMLLYLLAAPNLYGPELYFLKCWEFLGVVSNASLTVRGHELVWGNVKSILQALTSNIEKSKFEQLVCEALVKIINLDEWGGLLPLAEHKVASYISDLLFPAMAIK